MNTSQIENYCNAIAVAAHRLSDDENRYLCRSDIPYDKLTIIADMMINNYKPLSIPNLEQFSTRQLTRILEGMRSGIDYTTYANPKLSANDMAIIKSTKEAGHNVTVEDDRIIIHL